MKDKNMTFIKCILPLFVLVNVCDVKCTETLVLLENLGLKETHNMFFQILKEQGLHLTFKLADDPNLTLMKYGEYLFQNLIIFAPSTEEFGGSVTIQTITDFIDSGRNVMVGLDSYYSGSLMTELANECGLDIEEGSVIDHFNYDIKDDGNHTLLVIDPRSLINAPSIVDAKNIQPVLFQGVGILSDLESPLIIKVLPAASSVYRQEILHKTVGHPYVVDKNILHVAAVQARNDARVLFSGSIDLFSNHFFLLKAQRAHGNKTTVKSGNRELVAELSQWVFKNTGVLRIKSVTHHSKNETVEPTSYTVNDVVVYSIEVDVLRNGGWSVYEALDLQLEVVRINPFIRTPLKRQGTKFVAEVKLPDVYGVYCFKVDYNKLGYTHLFTSTQISIRPLEHMQYDRFIPQAYPYYLSAFSMMFGVFVFSIMYLYVDEPEKIKKD